MPANEPQYEALHDQQESTGFEARAQSPELSMQAIPIPSAKATLSTLNRPAAKPSIQVRFSIIKSRTPKLSKRYWENGALHNKTVDTLFAEISTLVGRRGIERISFQLKAEGSESEYVVARGDETTFADMRVAFSEEIKADKRATGNTRFEIWVEPDPVELRQGQSVDDDDEDLVF